MLYHCWMLRPIRHWSSIGEENSYVKQIEPSLSMSLPTLGVDGGGGGGMGVGVGEGVGGGVGMVVVLVGVGVWVWVWVLS